MKKNLLPLFFILSYISHGQNLTAPVAEGVFGGLVGDFETWSFSADSIYVVTSTFSPNSLFWAKAERNGKRNNMAWQVVPSADADDGFGSSIMNVEIHAASNTIFFLSQGTVYSTKFNSSSATTVETLVKDFIIHGDTMALVRNNPMAGGQDVLDFGALNSSGAYSKSGSISLLKNYTDPPQMLIHPSDMHLHLFERGSSPHRYKLMDAFYAMTNSTSLTSAVNPAPVRANIEWRTYAFDASGTWYVAGQPPLNNPTSLDRRIAFSTDNGLTWTDTTINTPGPIGGIVGNNIVFTENSGIQSLYIGNAVERDLASFGNWVNPGVQFIQDLNRANDGYTKQDALDGNIVYHSTNIGFGYSTERGDSIFGWNEGLTAVQVNDIDMTDDFRIGYVASKSGIRKVTGYNTPSPSWSAPHFPNFDGAPYTAVGMTPGMPDTVFVGNQRIYRTENGGTAIGPMNDGWAQVFTPEDPPLNYNRINTHCTGIAVAPDSANIIIAGFRIDFGDKGGCFYSTDGGNNWQQLLILASSPGQDADISDVVISRESGKVVAYIGLDADPVTAGHHGVYRAELTSTGFSVAADGSFGATDQTVDLELNSTGDSLYVLNRDPGLLPVTNVYIKDLNTGGWSNFAGPSAAGQATAITDGDGYVFISLDETIYMNSTDGSLGWSVGYAYPVGTEINVLFYDELLVGTGTGLYAHDLNPNIGLESDLNIDMGLQLYPNPADKWVQWDEPAMISVYDLRGLEIFRSEKPIKGLSTQTWSNGIYLIRFGKGHSAKIIIQH